MENDPKQIQESGRVLGLRVERIEVRPLHFDGIAGALTPFPVEIQTLPAVADRSPALTPSGLRPQHANDHPPAVTARLVAREPQEAIFPIRKILPLWDRNGPGFSRAQIGESFRKWSHRHRSTSGRPLHGLVWRSEERRVG